MHKYEIFISMRPFIKEKVIYRIDEPPSSDESIGEEDISLYSPEMDDLSESSGEEFGDGTKRHQRKIKGNEQKKAKTVSATNAASVTHRRRNKKEKSKSVSESNENTGSISSSVSVQFDESTDANPGTSSAVGRAFLSKEEIGKEISNCTLYKSNNLYI